MGTQGLLTKDKIGYSMPVDAPLYPPPPIFYEDPRIMLFPYLTDASRAAALLPAPLELVTVDPDGKLAVASMLFARYPFSTVGAYNEVGQNLAVTYKGQPGMCMYSTRLHVTNDQAMAAGREVGGFAKRIGDITFDEGAIVSSTLECPAGIRVCSAELTPIQPVPWLTTLPITFFALRVLPNPADPRTPSICELVKTDWLLEGTFWSARGMTTLTGASASNPYHSLPIVELLPPMDPQASTPEEQQRPGLFYFRGKMSAMEASVAERL